LFSYRLQVVILKKLEGAKDEEATMQRMDRLRLSYWRVWQMTEIANFGGDQDPRWRSK